MRDVDGRIDYMERIARAVGEAYGRSDPGQAALALALIDNDPYGLELRIMREAAQRIYQRLMEQGRPEGYEGKEPEESVEKPESQEN